MRLFLRRCAFSRTQIIRRGFCSPNEEETASIPPPSGSKSKSYLLHSLASRSDQEVVKLVNDGVISQYKLESELKKAVDAGLKPDCSRAVRIRREWLNVQNKPGKQRLSEPGLPHGAFDFETFYNQVLGKNCENVIGYVPMPVGFAGPLLLDGRSYYVPMATTEGALVASTNRGCRAIFESGGARVDLYDSGMTRAPAVQLASARQSVELKHWLEEPANFAKLKAAFEATTRFGKLVSVKTSLAGRVAHLRFKCTTGDAMGMNMVSQGVQQCMEELVRAFPEMEVLSISGNTCIDKKPSAMNWIQGRGRSVVAEVILSQHVITEVLKCTVQSLLELNVAKNLVGSALAGSIGGNNAHAANAVAAIFLATGQDPAQVVTSSNCLTLMESVGDAGLRVSVTMPCLEVGTVGGGTTLAAQRACLAMLGLTDPQPPGQNADGLARVVAGTVLAGEISLMSALASNHLVSAHLKLNREHQPTKDA